LSTRHEPTAESRHQVELCAAFGNTAQQTARILGISEATLRLYYPAELQFGRLKASNAVKRNLWRLATADDMRAVRAIELWMRLIEHASEYAPAPRDQVAAPKLGKKEAAQASAEAPPPDESTWSEILH
jgi:hypothetical protein